MYKFTNSIDLTDINDSMELEPGEEIACLVKGNYEATLEVRGEVRVEYKGVDYSTIAQMPQELKDYFHNKNWGLDHHIGEDEDNEDDEVIVYDNNWFEIFLWEKKGKELEWTGIAVVVDAENMEPSRVEEMLEELIDESMPEPK